MAKKALDERDALKAENLVLIAALRPIAAAYSDDPGTDDLYNEQPVGITLGDVRRARMALLRAGKGAA
jgi:hypothetical protein